MKVMKRSRKSEEMLTSCIANCAALARHHSAYGSSPQTAADAMSETAAAQESCCMTFRAHISGAWSRALVEVVDNGDFLRQSFLLQLASARFAPIFYRLPDRGRWTYCGGRSPKLGTGRDLVTEFRVMCRC